MHLFQLHKYEDVSESFRTGRLERELQMVQLSATRCSCIAILWVGLASFADITLCVASQEVFIVVSTHFVIDSVRKRLDTTIVYCCSQWPRPGRMSVFFFVLLSCVGTYPPVQGVLPKCPNGFIASEVNCESDQSVHLVPCTQDAIVVCCKLKRPGYAFLQCMCYLMNIRQLGTVHEAKT
jgi:hypothetical protein